MEIFAYMHGHDHEQVVFCHDRESGLKAIIAIHNTNLGPALGGTRMWPYASEEEALIDVLRLSRGMTYKAAMAGLALGGGKAVIIGNPAVDKTEALLRAYGRFIETLHGRYITAEDVGTGQPDMDIIRRETAHVVGVSPERGGSGDPSPYTARGVLQGMRAAAGYVFGSEELAGRRVTVQGLGQVGRHLCGLLAREGAVLTVSDINPRMVEQVVKEYGASAVAPDEVYDLPGDIFAPCALGAVVNDDTVRRLRYPLIAGSANNVLARDEHGDILHERGILYVPDYVINAGGLINVAEELYGYDQQRALEKVDRIYEHVRQVLFLARKENIPPCRAADRLAGERVFRAQAARPGFAAEEKAPEVRRVG